MYSVRLLLKLHNERMVGSVSCEVSMSNPIEVAYRLYLGGQYIEHVVWTDSRKRYETYKLGYFDCDCILKHYLIGAAT